MPTNLMLINPGSTKSPPKAGRLAHKINKTLAAIAKTIRPRIDICIALTHQTSEWQQIFNKTANGTFLLFFYVTPLENEPMYQQFQIDKQEKTGEEYHQHYGKYTQVAIYKANNRILIPVNIKGDAYIIGNNLIKTRSSFRWSKIDDFGTNVCQSTGFLIKFYVGCSRNPTQQRKNMCVILCLYRRKDSNN